MKFRNQSRFTLLFLAGALFVSTMPLIAQTVRVTGSVTDEAGEPVQGGVVTASGATAESGFTVETNGKGRFSVPGASPGSFIFSVEGYRISYIKMQPLGGGTLGATEPFEAELGPAELPPQMSWQRNGRYKITIRVTRAAADAAAGAGWGGSVEGLADDKSADLTILMDLFESQSWPELIAAADGVIAGNPESGGAFYLLGVAQWQSNQISNAVDSIRSAAGFIPDQPGINGTLGTLLLALGAEQRVAGDQASSDQSYSEAADLFLAQLDETPGSVVYLTNRVAALDYAGRTDELAGAIEELLVLDSANSSAYLRLAELKMSNGDMDGAFDVFERMPAGGVGAAALLYNAAVEMWDKGNLDGVVAAVDKGIGMAPEMAELYRLKAMALISVDQAQSVQLLEKYLGMAAEDAPGLDADRALLEELKARM
jgi:tetratricopeptide (TPR) repeat protein